MNPYEEVGLHFSSPPGAVVTPPGGMHASTAASDDSAAAASAVTILDRPDMPDAWHSAGDGLEPDALSSSGSEGEGEGESEGEYIEIGGLVRTSQPAVTGGTHGAVIGRVVRVLCG